MKKKPKVSIIMPVYNAEKFLKEAIESILNQTFKDFCFIIIDDNSTDSSLDIIKEYQKKDRRIILIRNKKKEGVARSLNKGLKLSESKYIARMDGDDISALKRIEVQVSFLERNKKIFLIGSATERINEEGIGVARFNPTCSEEKIKRNLLKNNCLSHPTIMFRKEEGIFYREKMRYAEDYDLYLRLLSRKKRLKNIPLYLLKQRIRSDSVCMGSVRKILLFTEKTKEFYFQREKDGEDRYQYFDPDKILITDREKIDNKEVLKLEIKKYFKLNKLRKTRQLSKDYFKNYGFSNRIIFYYLFSFLGVYLIKIIRRTFFIFSRNIF